MILNRKIEQHFDEYLSGESHKIFFVWGPRRSGKTFLLKKLSARLGVPLFNFDVSSDQEKFVPDRPALAKLAALPVILIDEVQSYPSATRALKILFDEFNVKIIATGSSELRRKSKDFDSLANRYTEHFCLPLSVKEMKDNAAPHPFEEASWLKSQVEPVAMFGGYPEVYGQAASEDEKIDLLQNILDTYVLKDIVDIYNLRNAKLAKDILTKVALQVGSEVSLRELASNLGANVQTVSNYVEIFIKNYILLTLPSFKVNMRRAVSAHRKLYFLDLGLRNILVKDFRPLELRPDKGAIWESFILAEMYKKIKNDRRHYSLYFYREYNGREVDLVIEDYKKNYRCWEAKFQGSASASPFPLPHTPATITRQNYYELLESL